MDPHGDDGSCSDPNSGLEESMRRLEIGGGGGNRSGGEGSTYPERPGERDCPYYLRTGTCGFGEKCRYNHPIDRGTRFQQTVGADSLVGSTYPQRHGQALCQHYLKTGTCKYGYSCKYRHTRQGEGSAQPVPWNNYLYPLRPGEEECPYFMRTGRCGYGATCKFHHPQPVIAVVPSPVPVLHPTSVATLQQYPEVGGWQFWDSSSSLVGVYMPNTYGHIVVSPGVIPLPTSSTYLGVTYGGQQSMQVGQLYGPHSQLSSSAPTYAGLYPHHVIPSIQPSTSTQQ